MQRVVSTTELRGRHARVLPIGRRLRLLRSRPTAPRSYNCSVNTPLAGFVRDVLGCGCPEEVLRSITVDRSRPILGLDVEVARLDVGGRLLVYVVPAPASRKLRSVVAAAVEAGISERDRRSFNRFRLVLACADPAEVEPAARAAFDACPRPDERVHLHVVSSAELSVLG